MHSVEERDDEGLVGCSSSSSSKRQRFYIQLKPGETTIISWKKLLRDVKPIDDDVIVTSSSGPHPSPARKALDDISEVGQRNSFFLRDERLRDKSRARSSGSKELRNSRVESAKIGEKNDGLAGRHWEEYEKVKANTYSTLNKNALHCIPSDIVKDHLLEGLHDAPLLTYSKKSALLSKRRCHLPLRPPVPVFPVKTNHDYLQNFGKKITKMEAPNASPNFISDNSASRSVPLQTYHRSRNPVNDKQNKVRRGIQDDNLISLTAKANANRNANLVPYLKRKVSESDCNHVLSPSPCANRALKKSIADHGGLQAKAPHPPAKSVKFTLSAERKPTTIHPQPHLTERNMEVREKANVKIRFHLKQEPETIKY